MGKLCRHVFERYFRIWHKQSTTKPEKTETVGTYQLVACADDANIMRENICTVKKKTKVLLVASKAICLEVAAEKTKYMIMP
jgi:fibrillarin-like rRNA methylase